MNYKRTRNLYDPKSEKTFKISRSKIDLFLECPRCFYIDRRLGIGRPDMPGFSLNDAVDELLKKEFDVLREKGHAHDIMKEYKIDALPYRHPELDVWRENFKGKEYLHKKTNLIITGAIDDIWEDRKGNLIIVDYKATSTRKEISLEDEYKQGYKKQIEVYQWIFRQSSFKVLNTAYFLFANGNKDRPSFKKKLEFKLSIIPYEGDDSWVEPTVIATKKCLDSSRIPAINEDCEFCAYLKEATNL